MPEFAWEAKGRSGEVRRGVMEAESRDAVQLKLKSQNMSPIKVNRQIPVLSPLLAKFKRAGSVNDKEIVIFVRQFATMIDAGLPLVQCLEILSTQGDNPTFNEILRDVKNNVEGGSTFSESLRRHPKVFDELFVNLIHAGEVGGILDTILNRLAVYIEKRVKLQRQVRSAMVYPAGVGGIAVIVVVVMLTYVIPSFENMFKEFGAEAELPAPTRIVIAISRGFLTWAPIIVAIVTAIGFGLNYIYRQPKGKAFFHRMLLAAPIMGPVMRKIAVARFTRTLSTLLASGVPLLEGLNIVAKSSGNVIIEKAILDTTDRIREGRTMSEPLGETGVFPPMVVQMISVGEQTGALDEMLRKIADFYEEEVDVAVEGLTSLLEPLMMVVIGGIVGFILIAMYLPIFDIAGKVKAE